ncbi:MAG: 4Fe-4S dicluster domain-containing protein [Deltaproteobacteria bacterium]|nr:4Fe-4S dicluster domain-containing protein [Deltaproteobacteria bacterium]
MKSASEPIKNIDTVFARQAAADWQVDLFACYQCGKCSNGCPVTFAMDILPHQLIRMLQLGLTEEVLGSKTIWVCSSCETCYTRCPNEIEIPKLMDNLKEEVLKKSRKPSQEAIARFHKAFLNNVKMFGRINETLLMGVYQIKSSWSDLKKSQFDFSGLLKNAGLGLSMLKRGRLSLFPRWNTRKEVRGLFIENDTNKLI